MEAVEAVEAVGLKDDTGKLDWDAIPLEVLRNVLYNTPRKLDQKIIANKIE